MEEQPEAAVDQDAMSRQLAAYQLDTQRKIMALKVFLLGARGLGAEIAKNLILTGFKRVVVCDNELVKLSDLASNFFLREHHVAKVTRAEAIRRELSSLNPAVDVQVTSNSDISFISRNFDCVVISDWYDLGYLIELSKACRKAGTGFIYTGNLGLYGFGFVDFGDQRQVLDTDGETCKESFVTNISRDNEGWVEVHDYNPHEFEDGSFVRFRQVRGMTEVNDRVFRIAVKSRYSFTIGNTTDFSPYESKGVVQQVKVPTFVRFLDLEEALSNPFRSKSSAKVEGYLEASNEFDVCDWSKAERPQQLHVALKAILQFYSLHRRLPRLLNGEDATELVCIACSLFTALQEQSGLKITKLDETVVANIARYAETQISPCCSFWGGIIAQEVIKLTGKYTPLRQWLHHDFLEILPEGIVRAPTNSRYSDYEVLFGRDFVENAARARVLLAGAGAIGCEFLKMASLMGLSTKGKLTCADADNVEVNNLCRQFLFRREDVGRNKSEIACAATRQINSASNFLPVNMNVSVDNEEYFNDDFWTQLDFVVAAVDNIRGRTYIDGQCVLHEKAMFDSGTSATKGSTQVVIPRHTQTYSDSADPPQQMVDWSTLKNFPYRSEHAIEWAKHEFENALVYRPAQAAKFLAEPHRYLAKVVEQNRNRSGELKELLTSIKRLTEAHQKQTYQACIELAREMFEKMFFKNISQLIHSFPKNHVTECQRLFWSGLKRAPEPIVFDYREPLHMEFIKSTADIFASVFGVKPETDLAIVAQMTQKVSFPKFKPVWYVRSNRPKHDSETEGSGQEDELATERLEKELSFKRLNRNISCHPIEFCKDDNLHIQQISSASNLRCRNYSLQEMRNFKVKVVAGRIVPAIITSTAAVAGATGIEVLKYILKLPAELSRNCFMNLALPLVLFSQPAPPILNLDKEYHPIYLGPIRAIPPKFTAWDKIYLRGPLTISQIEEYFQRIFNVRISMLSCGQCCLYNRFIRNPQAFSGRTPLEVYQEKSHKPISKNKKFMLIDVCGELLDSDIDAIMPSIRYEL